MSKYIYCKLLTKFVISGIDGGKTAIKIIRGQGLKSNCWLKTAWEQVTDQYIPNCFKNCGFEVPSSEVSILDDSVDNEYEEAFDRLSGSCGLIIYGFVGCDDTLVTEKGKINTNSVDWRETTRHKEDRNNEIKGIETNQYC